MPMTAFNTCAGASPVPAESRLAFLDGLRGVAILLVIGFHYFSLFADGMPDLYPYGNLLKDVWILKYGYYGVHLFFAISGFVIALSLERSHSFMDFAFKRFARLWPTMLLCSAISFAVLSIWPTFWPQRWENFLPSLSFIDPLVWNRLIPTFESGWIDGVYWTLFVEVRFYFWAALIYWVAGRFFLPSVAVVSSIAVSMHLIFLGADNAYAADVFQMALIAKYWPWFLLGIGGRILLKGQRWKAATLALLAGMQLLLLVYSGMPKADVVVFVLIAAVLSMVAYSAALRSWLEASWLVAVGVTSYSLYLLHQNAGLTLISILASWMQLEGPMSLLVAILVFFSMVFLSRWIYRWWESPLNRILVRGVKRLRATRSTPSELVARVGHAGQS